MKSARRQLSFAAAGLMISLLVVQVGAGSKPAFDRSVVRHEGRTAIAPRLHAVIARAQAGGRAELAARAEAARIPFVGDRFLVVVEPRDGQAGPAKQAIEAVGGVVTGATPTLLEARMTAGQLEELAADSAIAYIRGPALHYPDAVSEGVAAVHADVWHAAGVSGSGVKVGIIDLGFAGYQGLLGSDLPVSPTTKLDLCLNPTSTNHGTAVAEIVYDVAPGAQLFLICIEDEVDLAAAEAYAEAQGISIIVHAVGWYETSRGDGTGGPGTPDAIVAQARAAGILWLNSAGNQAQSHWGGSFIPVADRLANPGSVQVSPGGTVCLGLKWDAWPVTTSDFDLLLVDGQTILAASAANQADGPLPPIEELCWTNAASSSIVAQVYLVDYNAPGFDGQLDLFVFNAAFSSTSIGAVAPRSLGEPATSPNALAVGAACWSSGSALAPGGEEPYSSHGPTIDGRFKPDVVAPDTVSTATYGAAGACGASGFAGTSAAVAHVGGLAALLKAKSPTLTVAQLQGAIERGALNALTFSADLQAAWGLPVALQRHDAIGAGFARLHLPTGVGPLVVSRPAWVPKDGGSLCCVDNLFMVNGDGTSYTRITTDETPNTEPDFTAAGDEIFYVRGGQLHRIGVEGVGDVQVGTQTHGAGGLDVSPDGSKIAMFGGNWPGTSYEEIFTIDAIDGSNATRLTTTTDSNRHPHFSPDGAKIVFAKRDGVDFEIATINALDGSSFTTLTSNIFDENEPVYSPDGSKIVFARSTGNYGIFSINTDGSGETQLTNVSGDLSPEFTPEGSAIAFVRGALMLMNDDGSMERALGAPGNTPAWNPLGSATPLRAIAAPLIAGTAAVGQYVQATTGVWLGGLPIVVSFQWQLCDFGGATCADVAGATDSSYRLTASEVGKTVRVQIAAANAAGTTTVSSPVSAAITDAAPSFISRPVLAGVAQVGQTLSSTTGSWGGSPSLTVGWLRCDVDGGFCSHVGSTGSTYLIQPGDQDSTIRSLVTATTTGGATRVTSTPTAKVAPAPPGGGGGGGGGGGSGSNLPDIQLVKTVDRATAAVGDSILFRLQSTVKNYPNTSGGSDLVLTDPLPANVELVSVKTNRGSCAGGRTVVCQLSALWGTLVADVEVVVRVTGPGEIVNTATVRATETDPDLSNNTSTARVNAPVLTPPTPAPPPPRAPAAAKGVTKSGTAKGETLRGTPHADRLDGRGGPDRILGLGGNDVLIGGVGRDVIEAGPGKDVIRARDGARDTVRCGLGVDTAIVDRLDAVAGCETVRRA